jgi:hypothetical protein
MIPFRLSDRPKPRPLTEEQRVVLGYRPRTLRGWWFWLKYWSPPAIWLVRLRGR